MVQAAPLGLELSGIAPLAEEGAYLVCQDTKTGLEKDWVPRVGVLKITEDGRSRYQDLGIVDWGEGQEIPNDVEAVCTVAGRPGEYLLVESGFYKGRFGRIFHLGVTPVAGTDLYMCSVLGHFQPEPPAEPGWTTPGHLQFEGAATFESGGRLWLALGRRGGPKINGELLWGELDLKRWSYKASESVPLVAPGLRACADLYLGFNDELLCVAASDPGNLGPFRSYIYRVGRFQEGASKPTFRADSERLWTLDGLKVEALGPCWLPGSSFCVGTDDEVYGGAWRPLPTR